MTELRKILQLKHENVDHWSIKSFANKTKCYIVDALDPVTYWCEKDKFWKKFEGNNKKYPLTNNFRDEEYYKALLDIRRIKA